MISTIQVNFRMPTKLKETLEAAAKDSNRTTTSEIVARLEQSFKAKSSRPLVMIEFHSADVQAFFSSLVKRLQDNEIATNHLFEVLEEFNSAQDNKKAP
jgi:hypothetical protein